MHEVVFTALTSIVASIVTWIAARRKNLAEVQTNELDNVNKAVGYYREMFDDMAKSNKAMMAELQSLRAQSIELDELKVRYTALERQVKKLSEELKKYKLKSNENKDI